MRKMGWISCCVLACTLVPSVLMAETKGKPTIPRILSISPSMTPLGETVTISGRGFSKDAGEVVVKIDGKEASIVDVKSDKEITVLVDTLPEESAKNAGEYERSVVVTVRGKESQPGKFIQITWGVVLRPRVFIAVGLYLLVIGSVVLTVKGSVFRSQTGQLSLSKMQMGLWTFIFGLCYVLLSATYKEFLDISEGMFWLMGISSATAVGAKAIVIKNKPKPIKPSTLLHDFDAKSNMYRLSLHRCQIAIWTLIVLAIYLIQLIDTMSLPDIPNHLLVLMGISGGTYLGFNYPK